MSDVDTLIPRFEAATMKTASRSRMKWWLDQEGADASLRKAFIRRVLDWGLWQPWDKVDSRLASETRRVSAGYRDAARSIRAITLHPTRRSILGALGLMSLLLVWLAYLFLGGSVQWARLVQALIFGLPPFLAGALRLARAVRPGRIELSRSELRATRGGLTLGEVRIDEIAFVDFARITDPEVNQVIEDLPRGKLNWLTGSYKSGAWAVYAQLHDGTVVVLADHIDETTAKATVIHLERELELGTVRVRVDGSAAQDDESVAARVHDGTDGDAERTATG